MPIDRRQTTDAAARRPWTRHDPVLFAAGVVLIAFVLFAANLWQQYRERSARAHTDVQNLVGILEQNIAGRLHTIDYALAQIAREVEAALREGTSETLLSDSAWLHQRQAGLPQLAGMAVVRFDGIVSAATTIPSTPGLDISDRRYFQAVQEAPDGQLHISTPYEARGRSGLWAISLSRAITNPDGSFGGIVVGSMTLDRLAATLAAINTGPSGGVAMWNAGAVLLASHPVRSENIGQPRPALAPRLCTAERRATSYEGTATSTMPVRIAACRRLTDYPIVVSVGLGRSDVFADWWREAALHAVVLLIFSLAVFGLAWRVSRLHRAAVGSAEARLRDAIESIGDAMALYDAHGRLEVWNSKLLEFMPHLAALQPLKGRTFEELLRASIPHVEDAAADEDIEAYVTQRLRERAELGGEPKLRATKDGRWMLVHERPTSLGGIVVLRTDVTSLKRNEARLEQLAENLAAAKHQAEEASRAKSRFLASMSHELRTPLNAIIGFSELIEKQVLGPTPLERYADYARDIRRSGIHLLELINDILDMSKIEAGKREIIDEMLDLVEVADSCVRMLQGRATELGVKLSSTIPETLPRLRADRRAVKQVLLNLLSNAVKFTPKGGSVCIDAEPMADGRLRVVVTDTGVGIPRDQLATVFEPFRQIDRQGHGKPEGTGLGLSICRGLLESHEGSIEITSEPGRGTVVEVFFPAARTVDVRAVALAE